MQQKLEATLAQLVSFPSVSADTKVNHELISQIAHEMRMLGLFVHHESDTSHPWLIATTQETKTPDILLAAHLDVVPAPDALFTMKKENGKLYGRGVYDMKLAAACYLELLKAHQEELSKLNIGVLFTTDEEIGGNSLYDVLGRGLRPKVVFLPDGGGNWLVEKRAKGLYIIELIALGKSAHGSRPWEGKSALHTILDIAQILRAKYSSDHPSDATLSINRLRSGQVANQVPEHASMAIDFRTFDKQELEDYKLLIAELARIHDLQVLPVSVGDPLLLDEEHPNVREFLETLKEYTGRGISYCESYGASDGRFFAQHDIPCIITEPHGGGRHSNEEWLEANDLEQFYRLIEYWVMGVSAAAPQSIERITAQTSDVA